MEKIDLELVCNTLMGPAARSWRFLVDYRTPTPMEYATVIRVRADEHSLIKVDEEVLVKCAGDKRALAGWLQGATLKACGIIVDALDKSLDRPPRLKTKAGFVECPNCKALYLTEKTP